MCLHVLLEYGYQDLSDAFKESSCGAINFEKQYASAYFLRIELLRRSIEDAARTKWIDTGVIGQDQLVGHVKSYKAQDEKDIVLIGVLYKDMSLKPSVLSDIQNNMNLSDQFLQPPTGATVQRRTYEKDISFLEDMEARLQLVGGGFEKLVTGLVVGVLGRIDGHTGFFNVHDYVLPGYPIPTALAVKSPPMYVAIVSGLQIGSPNSNPMAFELLKEFLMGNSFSDTHKELASKIARLIVAGDTLYVNQERDPSGTALIEADLFLAEMASLIPVDLMPGARDPTNFCIPQQPLHSGLFPEAKRLANLSVHTNPYKLKIGDTVILGTSGQNVTDVIQYSDVESGIEALELIARSRYLAPTAPDTLASYPMTSSDPLIVTPDHGGYPHVLFAGNQAESTFRGIDNGRGILATTADFAVNPSILLVNVNDISDVQTISFSVPQVNVA